MPIDHYGAQAVGRNTYVHKDDLNSYSRPDEVQSARLGRGVDALVVPRATRYGASSGFSPGPAVMSIEPTDVGSGSGGVIVDASKISPAMSKRLVEQAWASTEDPEEQIIRAYELLGQAGNIQSAPVVEKQAKANTFMPEQPARVKANYVQGPVEPTADVGHLTQMVAELTHTIANLQAANARPVAQQIEAYSPQPRIHRNVEEEDIAMPTRDDMVSKQKAFEIIKMALDSLNIPDLSIEPNQPQYRVSFDLGMAGQQEAWYHWVIETPRGLFLVYDTRFKFGMKYRPPYLGNESPVRISFPDLDNQAHLVFLMDFIIPFGTFEIIILPIAVENKEPEAHIDLQGM